MSYWQKCYHCLHYKSFWQLPTQPVMMILSNWQHNCFSEAQNLCIILCYELWAVNWFILLTKTFVSSLSDPHIWLMWPAVTFVRSLSDPDNKDIPGCLRVTYHTLRKKKKKIKHLFCYTCNWKITQNMRTWWDTGLILGLRPTNKRRRYCVSTSLIGWMQAWNQPWDM